MTTVGRFGATDVGGVGLDVVVVGTDAVENFCTDDWRLGLLIGCGCCCDGGGVGVGVGLG